MLLLSPHLPSKLHLSRPERCEFTSQCRPFLAHDPDQKRLNEAEICAVLSVRCLLIGSLQSPSPLPTTVLFIISQPLLNNRRSFPSLLWPLLLFLFATQASAPALADAFGIRYQPLYPSAALFLPPPSFIFDVYHARPSTNDVSALPYPRVVKRAGRFLCKQ